MFNWFDKKIDDWFDQRKLEREARIDEAFDKKCDELENYCNIVIRNSKDKYSDKAKEFGEFVEGEVERLKKESTKLDVKVMVQEAIKNYIHENVMCAQPVVFYSDDDQALEAMQKEYPGLELMDVSSFVCESYDCGGDVSLISVCDKARDNVRDKALEFGSQIGADVMWLHVVTSKCIDRRYISSNFSSATYEVHANVKFYKIKEKK